MCEDYDYSLCIPQGTDFDRTVRYTDNLGNYIDMTGWGASMTARYMSEDGPLAFEATNGNGMITVEDGTYLRIRLSSELTGSLTCGKIVYDLHVVDLEGKTHLLLNGNITLSKQVVHEPV